MIYEAFHPHGAIRDNCDPTTGLTVLVLSVATSIDAFAVGPSLEPAEKPSAPPVAVSVPPSSEVGLGAQ